MNKFFLLFFFFLGSVVYGEFPPSDLPATSLRNLEILKDQYPQFYEKTLREIALLLSPFEKGGLSADQPLIPAEVHFIWLGPENLPSETPFDSWKQLNPDYKIFLWSDQPRKGLPPFVIQKNISEISPLKLQQQFEETVGWKEKSWLLRLEILAKRGGIYADLDRKCLAPFEELRRLRFFSGLSSVSPMMGHCIQVSNLLIGSIPSHPIIIGTIEEVKRNWELRKQELLSIGFCDEKPLETYAPLLHLKRLYLPLTTTILNRGLEEKEVIFPPHYFNYRGDPHKKGMYAIKQVSSQPQRNSDPIGHLERRAKRTLAKCYKLTRSSLYLSLSAILLSLFFIGWILIPKLRLFKNKNP